MAIIVVAKTLRWQAAQSIRPSFATLVA